MNLNPSPLPHLLPPTHSSLLQRRDGGAAGAGGGGGEEGRHEGIRRGDDEKEPQSQRVKETRRTRVPGWFIDQVLPPRAHRWRCGSATRSGTSRPTSARRLLFFLLLVGEPTPCLVAVNHHLCTYNPTPHRQFEQEKEDDEKRKLQQCVAGPLPPSLFCFWAHGMHWLSTHPMYQNTS